MLEGNEATAPDVVLMPAPARGVTVLLVDDDPLLRETLSFNLEDRGLSVLSAGSGEEALRLLGERDDVEAVILDWKMPGMNGLDTLRAMRAGGSEVPTLFLTSMTDQIYEESALATGAVDFVDKSRSFAILLHRLDMVLAGRRGAEQRREAAGGAGEAGDGRERVGPLALDQETGRAYWHDTLVPLTLTEFQIVYRLASDAGRDVRYREIYNLVHGDGFYAGSGEDGFRTNVRTFVKRIRRKFLDLDEGFCEIENYPGFGYRWRASGS